MPIEEVTLTPTDKISLSSKRLEREVFGTGNFAQSIPMA